MQLAEADGLGLAEADVGADAEDVDAGEVEADAGAELPAVREGEAGFPAVCEDDACGDVELALGLAEAEVVAECPVAALCEDELPAAAPPVSAPLPEAEACGSALPAGALEATGVAGAALLSVVSASSPRPATASTPAVLSASTLVPRERLRRRPRRGAVERVGNGARRSAAEGSPYRATAVGSRITSSAVGRSPADGSSPGRPSAGRSAVAGSVGAGSLGAGSLGARSVAGASGTSSSAGRPHPGQFKAPLSRRRQVGQ